MKENWLNYERMFLPFGYDKNNHCKAVGFIIERKTGKLT